MSVAPVDLYFEPSRRSDEELDRRRGGRGDNPRPRDGIHTGGNACAHHQARFSEYLELMHKAVSLSEEDIDDLDAIHALGQG